MTVLACIRTSGHLDQETVMILGQVIAIILTQQRVSSSEEDVKSNGYWQVKMQFSLTKRIVITGINNINDIKTCSIGHALYVER